MAIRVVVADDCPLVLAGVRRFVARCGLKIVGEATTGEKVLEQVMSKDPDLVLLDMGLPATGGLTVLGRIKQEIRELPVVMFSTDDVPIHMAKAIAMEAAGYLFKDIGPEAFVAALKKAAAGETLFSRDQRRQAATALATPYPALNVDVPLTVRELEVLAQLTEGSTNKAIGRALGLGHDRVKAHAQRVFRKIGVTDRTQAAIWAVRNGLDRVSVDL